tara:strand:+ start:1607 stop:4216 length:2610 start_codon:yes stop_codon:yes gene_type:complete
MAIRRPGVEITQEFVTTSPTVITPDLTPVIVGPAVQVVDAFDDSGTPQSSAYAGTYQDGNGTIAYSLPSLESEADPEPYSDSIRVFMMLGDGKTELKSSSDEATVLSASTSATFDYASGASKWTDETQDFVTSGVEVGDYVRTTYQGDDVDIKITAVTATSLSVPDFAADDFDVTSYSIIRNPAQFIYRTSDAQADVEVGLALNPESNYLKMEAKAGGDAEGTAGDSYSLVIQESKTFVSGSDGATTGTAFTSATGGFQTAFEELVSDPTDYSIVIAGEVSDVAAVVSDTQITLDGAPAAGDGTSQAFKIIKKTADAFAELDTADKVVYLTLGRAAAVSQTSLADAKTALDADSAIANAFTTSVGGAGNLVVGNVGTTKFDGGADDDALLLDADIIGDTVPTGKIYVSYKALRKANTAAAATPSMASFDNTKALETGLGPLTADNPLGLGMYFALSNSSKTVKGLGVSDVSASEPNGTSTAYSEALGMLEGEDVYAIAPLTQSNTVNQLVSTHVTNMSKPSNKSERIAFISQALPGYSKATLIASGTAGNTGAGFHSSDSTAVFTTSVDFSALDTAPAADDILVITAFSSSDDSPDIVRGTDNPFYGLKIDGIDSSSNFKLEVDTATSAGRDAPSSNWSNMTDVSWSLYRPGTAISSTADIATRVATMGASYANRRLFLTWPPQVQAVVDGTSTFLGGQYLSAAYAGKVGEENPEKGFTNMTVTGFTGAKYTNGYFSESQLDTIAGGGTMISVQTSESAPLSCRHQLSTDVTSVQKRELNITKSIDYVAKTMRAALKSQIGQFNITSQFMDSLTVQIQGLCRFFEESGVVNECALTSLEVDSDSPDTINVVMLLDVKYPCNYIALTLQV